jgi:hypothetical protein
MQEWRQSAVQSPLGLSLRDLLKSYLVVMWVGSEKPVAEKSISSEFGIRMPILLRACGDGHHCRLGKPVSAFVTVWAVQFTSYLAVTAHTFQKAHKSALHSSPPLRMLVKVDLIYSSPECPYC